MEGESLLRGVKVAAFTQFLLGPSAVQYLADLGADVIKVEPPHRGAWERSWSGSEAFPGGESLFFLLANRNQRSLAVDLKTQHGLEVARRLIKGADVLVANYRPGVMEALGLGERVVRELNPRIVYASASGYGSDGPYQRLPGQDLLVQAVSGLAAVTGTAGSPPTPVGAAVVDQHGASLLALGIVSALLGRERNGQGLSVEVAMLDAALDLQVEPVTYFANGGKVERPEEPIADGFHSAPYGVYAADDGYLVISMAQVSDVAQAVGCAVSVEAVNGKAAFRQRDEIHRQLSAALKQKARHEVIGALEAAGVWCAPVNDYATMLADPGIRHLDPFFECDHSRAGRVKLLKHPVRYNGHRCRLGREPPQLGEHSRQVLDELGYTPAEVDSLIADGVIQ